MLLLTGVAVSKMSFLRLPSRPRTSVGADDALDVFVALGGSVPKVVGLVN